jgi:hypothetical protein
MIKEHNGYVFKIKYNFFSTSICYRFKMYKKRKFWFPKHVWTQNIYHDEVGSRLSDKFDFVIDCYYKELNRWE